MTTSSQSDNAAVSDFSAMGRHVDAAAELLRALASPHRLMILCALSEREQSVGELNERVELSQSALSQHLAVLRDEALVLTRRESQTIYYSLAPGPALEVVRLLHSIYCPVPRAARKTAATKSRRVRKSG